MNIIISSLCLLVFIIVIAFISIKTSEHKYRNWEKVDGKIIEFIEENGLHYPVFSYTTKEGKTVVSRNVPKNNEPHFDEAPIERIFPFDDDAKQFLEKSLPITEVEIKYNPEFDEQFLPKY